MPLTRPRWTSAATALVLTTAVSLFMTFASRPATAQARRQGRPTGPAAAATPAERIKAPKGSRVELLSTVPRGEQGSWVNMTVDPKGRLIASDQYGKLFLVTPPPIGDPASVVKVGPIAVNIGEAQGLCWAFDSLYVVVNGAG